MPARAKDRDDRIHHESNRDVRSDLFAHAVIHEYIHSRLRYHATQMSQAPIFAVSAGDLRAGR
ncbi:MAG TPA: hypothetical protein VF148_01795 [Acidimicrobiia bacterium]